MTSPLVLELLGLPRVGLGEDVVLPTRKASALLAYLAIAGATPRGELATLLWSDQSEAAARRNLRQELHRLRSTPLGPWLASAGDRLALREGAVIDVAAFDAAAERHDWATAVALYRGPLLQGLELKGGAGFSDWLSAQRERCARAWRLALAGQAQRLEAEGDLIGALRLNHRLLEADPLLEKQHREVMRLLFLRGERGAALAQYDSLRRLLRNELAIDPLPETVALAHRIRLAEEQSQPVATNAARDDLRTPLIGRDSAWSLISVTGGKLALIEGEAGIGKSRLAQEFGQAHGTVLRIKGHEISRDTPFYPIAEALLQAWREETSWLEQLDPVWQEEVARLLPTLALGDQPSQMPIAEARARFLEGLTVALLTAARGGCLIFDDLQWFDSASAELVVHLVRRAHRVRLLATIRADDSAERPALRAALEALASDNLLTRVPLMPLSEAEVLTMVRALSGSQEASVFSRRLHAATAGNPLFIIESLRELFSAGVLWSAEGTWATPYDEETEDYRELPISRSVREAVLRRIDRLGPNVRRVLEAASLAGDGFQLAWIGPDSAISEADLVDAADCAVRANVLVESDTGYQFAHDLMRRSLDDALSAEHRKLLHRQLALAMETADAPARLVARHLEAGGRRGAAGEHRVRAAEAAARVHALPEALAQYDAALADGVDDTAAFGIHSARLEVFRNLGDDDGRRDALAAMAKLGGSSSDPLLELELAVKQTVDHFEHDRYEAALESAQDALDHLGERIDKIGQAALLLELGATLHALGRIEESEVKLAVALERYRDVSPLKYANCAYWLCQCALARGDLARAQTLSEVSLEASERAGYRRGHALSLSVSAELAFESGDTTSGIQRLERACGEAREIGSLSLQRVFLEKLLERLTQLGNDEYAARCRAELTALASPSI